MVRQTHKLLLLSATVGLMLLSECLFASDTYQNWKSFVEPFSGNRLLFEREQRWLRLVSTAKTSERYKVNRIFSDFYKPQSVSIPKFESVEDASAYERKFTAPRFRITYPHVEQGIQIEISGQSIQLPRILASGQDDDFVSVLNYWMSRNLSPLIHRVKVAQQEYGWSDFELIRLVRFYRLSLLNELDGIAFEFSFWQQAFYALQLVQQNNQWHLLFRLNQPVPTLPFVRFDDQSIWWGPTIDADEYVFAFDPRLRIRGQAIRFTSINDRARTDEFELIPMPVSVSSESQNTLWEIPSHWSQISLFPCSVSCYLSEPVPDYVYQQLMDAVNEAKLSRKALALANLWKTQFKSTDQPLSIQQALYSQQKTRLTGFQMLSGWWRWQTQQSVAVIQDQQTWFLALQFPDDEEPVSSILNYRKRQWWLWTDNLEPGNAVQISNQARWIFIP